MPIHPDTHAALKSLRKYLPLAAADLNLDLGAPFSHWAQTLDRKLLPRLHRDFPLVAAVCGGGSTGKSTLFNALIGRPVSPVGGRAGMNRRVLAAMAKGHGRRAEILDYLGHAFGGAAEPLEHQEQLLAPGPPLYCESEALPEQLVLLDTPDIDTGAQGRYANRDLARQSLEVADLFIYVFTNATYNNLDNTGFMARMFAGMGVRPCYLVYRVYPSFADDEVRAHARTVTGNIYGGDDGEDVLGLFRADEDNAVAAREKPVHLSALEASRAGLDEALAGLDPAALRTRLLETMVADAVRQAREMAGRVHEGKDQLDGYARALAAAQRECVQMALSHFPTDRVLRRFAQIWLESDPPHIKLMRTTGKVIEWPLKTVLKTVHRLRSPDQARRPPTSEDKLLLQLETDLLAAANHLYRKSVDHRLSTGAQSVAAPAAVHPAQARLADKPWQATLELISAKKREVLSWSARLDEELKALADNLRRRMGLMDQIRQTFAAVLNVIPATAAITYILHTGDPVGAAGIKVKLTGIFGLHDLYALIAIPATAGMTKADRRQLEMMLGPLAQTWLAHKLQVVQELFEQQISGEIIHCVHQAQERADASAREIDRALELAGGRYKKAS